MRTVLGHVRSLRLLPRLTGDDLRDALKKHRAPRKRIVFMKPADCQRLLEAALAHDDAMFAATREEHAGLKEKGITARYEPIAVFVAFVLLTGMRVGEALSLEWKEVDLDATDVQGRPVGEIYLDENKVKTRNARTVTLEVSPFLRRLLVELRKRRSKGKPTYSEWTQPVFDLSYDVVDTEAKRLRDEYAAPRHFSYQVLRSTCGSFLTNAPGIFGAASAYRSAKQLGHSILVAEKHYLGLLAGIPLDAKTLEAAMGIESLVEKVMGRLLGESKSGSGPLQQPVDGRTLN
jgi:integrase